MPFLDDAARIKSFFSRTEKHGDCLIWIGCRWNPGRERLVYGKARYKGRLIKARRLAYILFVGPLPKGKVLRHSCDTPLCVNHEHLKPGTHAENLLDSIRRGRRSLYPPSKQQFDSQYEEAV